MSLSNYAENELLDHVLNNAAYTPPATVYVGLSTADPGEDGSGLAEPSGGSYARKAITFGAAAARRITQSVQVVFDQATAGWGNITHYAIFDAVSGGNMLDYGQLAATLTVNSGRTAVFVAGQIYIEFTAGYISTYLANKLLDLMFRNQAYASPSTYAGFATATIGDSDTGSTVTQPSGGGYARLQVNPNGGSSPTWDLAVAGVVDNTHLLDFGTASADWGIVVASFVADALTAGNILFYDNGTADQAVFDGDDAQVAVGAFDCSLD